jgi:hypothetical protein
MTQSTPLDQLGSNGDNNSLADEERVKRILAEMNTGDTIQGPPPVQPAPMHVITEPPISMSMGQIRMDPGTARAHVIGNSTPTMADFQAMFQQASPGMAPYHGPLAVSPGPMIAPARKGSDWRGTIMEHLRLPIIVASIVFLLHLPVVTAMLSRYASWMYLSSGEISMGGLLVKALLGGLLFMIYQTISSLVDATK